MLRWNVFALRVRLESQEGHRVPLRVITEETKISQNALSGMMRGTPRRVDLDQIENLLAFFRSHGLQVGLNDLLIEE